MAQSAMELMRKYADILREAEDKAIKEAEEKEVSYRNPHTGSTTKARQVKGKSYGNQKPDYIDLDDDGDVDEPMKKAAKDKKAKEKKSKAKKSKKK